MSLIVVHADGDPHNNELANLRIVESPDKFTADVQNVCSVCGRTREATWMVGRSMLWARHDCDSRHNHVRTDCHPFEVIGEFDGMCPVCEGSGEHEGHPDDPSTGPCEACSGTGLDADVHWALSCAWCGGDLANGMTNLETVSLRRAHMRANPTHIEVIARPSRITHQPAPQVQS